MTALRVLHILQFVGGRVICRRFMWIPVRPGGGPPEDKEEREEYFMIYSTEVQNMCPVAKGAYHGPAPIPEEGKWV